MEVVACQQEKSTGAKPRARLPSGWSQAILAVWTGGIGVVCGARTALQSIVMNKQLTGFWKTNFIAALAPLLLLKVGLLVNNLWGTEGYEPAHEMIAKSLLFFGSDILGAGLVAGLLVLVAWPLMSVRGGKVSARVMAFGQFGHAFFCGFSFFSVIYQGGPVNKQALEAGLFDQTGTVADWLPAVWYSFKDYVNVWNLTFYVVVVALPLVVLLYAPRLLALVARRRGRILRWVLVGEMAVTILAVPYLMSGEIGGIRIMTYSMEKSPVLELCWSYLRPALKSLRPGDPYDGDPFFFDMSSMVQEGEELSTPLLGAAPAQSNVILVVAESVGAPYLEDKDNPMPFLASVGHKDGQVAFKYHYASWSLTTKAMFSLLCSELPYPNYKPITMVNPAIPCVSLPEVLKEAGYFTAYVSSQDLAFDRQVRFLRHRGIDMFWDLRTMPGHEGAWQGPWGVEDRLTVDNILDLVRDKRDQPFFILFQTFAAHHPFIVAQEHEQGPELERVAAYMRAINYLDQQLERLSDGLAELGVADNTLLVIVSDHGEGHGLHAGRNAYQAVIQVPLVFVGPQLAGVSGQVTATTHHVDIAPTILGLLGIEPPCTMKGRDLTRPAQQRAAFFGGRPPKFQLGLADGRWKYIIEDESLEMLYDIVADPDETTNLMSQEPDLAGRFRRRVEQWALFSENLIENYGAELKASDCRVPGTGARPAP